MDRIVKPVTLGIFVAPLIGCADDVTEDKRPRGHDVGYLNNDLHRPQRTLRKVRRKQMRQLNFLNRMLPVLAAIALSACGGAPSESDHIGKQTNSGAIRIWSYVSIRNPGSEERRQHVQIENESEVRSIHPLGFEIFLTAFIKKL